MIKISTVCAFFPVLICLSCNFTPKEKIVPAWDTEILGPLAKTELNTENIFDLGNMHETFSFGLRDLELPIPIPPIVTVFASYPETGPHDLGPEEKTLNEGFTNAEIESGELYFVITNNLELGIKPGTKIILKNNNAELYNGTVPGLAANGGSFTLSPSISLANKFITPDFILEIKNMYTAESKGQVTINPDNRITIDLYVKNLKVKSLSATAEDRFEMGDTLDFSLKGTNIKAEATSGLINTYLDNGMPLDYKFQVYFLNEDFVVVDSLFDSTTDISAAPKDGTGVATSSIETKLVTKVNEKKLTNLLQAAYAAPYFKSKINGAIKVRNTDKIKLQLVGDLTINVNQ